MASDTTRYTNKVFMTGALPLLKTIANDVPELKKKFEGVNAVYQVSAMANAQDKEGMESGRSNWVSTWGSRRLTPNCSSLLWRR